jgi:hypothetical protein
MSCSIFVPGDLSASAAVSSSGALLQLRNASRSVASAAALNLIEVEVIEDGWEPGAAERRLAGLVLGRLVEVLADGREAGAGRRKLASDKQGGSLEASAEGLTSGGRSLAGTAVVDVLVRLSRSSLKQDGLQQVANEVGFFLYHSSKLPMR